MLTAMVCDGPGKALHLEHRSLPVPGPGEVLVRVLACGVCRTDLHVVDGDFYGVGMALAGEKSPYLVDAVWSTAASNVETA